MIIRIASLDLPEIPPWGAWLAFAITIAQGGQAAWRVVTRLRTRREASQRRERAETAAGRAEVVWGASLSLACAVFWSVGYVSLKVLAPDIPPLHLTSLVLIVASLSLLVASNAAVNASHGRQPGRGRGPGWLDRNTAFLLLANQGNFLLSILALSYVSASQAMSLNNVFPVFLALILVVRGKRSFSASTLATVVMVTLGAALLTVDDGFRIGSGRHLMGSIIALCAGFSFAVWADRTDEVKARLPDAAARWRYLAGVFGVTGAASALAAVVSGPYPALSAAGVLLVLFNGVRVAIVYALFEAAVRRVGPLLPTVLVVLQVPLTIVVERVWLGEPVSARVVMGALTIMLGGGVLLADRYLQPPVPSTA